MRINKVIKLITLNTLWVISLVGLAYPSFLCAQTESFSSSEIKEFSKISQEKTNSLEIQQWVNSIQHRQPFLEKADTHDQSRRGALMILVSSSVPMQSLHRYLVDGTSVHATMVLRGLVNNSFRDTAAFIHQALMRRKGGMQVDPIVFEKLNISRVPAVVLLNSVALECINQNDCIPNPADYDVVTGEVTLEYALNEIVTHGTAHATHAKALLTQLRLADHV